MAKMLQDQMWGVMEGRPETARRGSGRRRRGESWVEALPSASEKADPGEVDLHVRLGVCVEGERTPRVEVDEQGLRHRGSAGRAPVEERSLVATANAPSCHVPGRLVLNGGDRHLRRAAPGSAGDDDCALGHCRHLGGSWPAGVEKCVCWKLLHVDSLRRFVVEVKDPIVELVENAGTGARCRRPGPGGEVELAVPEGAALEVRAVSPATELAPDGPSRCRGEDGDGIVPVNEHEDRRGVLVVSCVGGRLVVEAAHLPDAAEIVDGKQVADRVPPVPRVVALDGPDVPGHVLDVLAGIAVDQIVGGRVVRDRLSDRAWVLPRWVHRRNGVAVSLVGSPGFPLLAWVQRLHAGDQCDRHGRILPRAQARYPRDRSREARDALVSET